MTQVRTPSKKKIILEKTVKHTFTKKKKKYQNIQHKLEDSENQYINSP